MTTRQLRVISSVMITWAVLCFATQNVAHCQLESFPAMDAKKRTGLMLTGERKARNETCATRCSAKGNSVTMPLIVVGFVGGRVKADDVRHPEVQLSAELRRRYPRGVYAEVFANRKRETAFRQILRWLDTDGNGTLTVGEKQQARIVIYGHSWGASETVTLARELARSSIPVLLTIQVDSIAKPGEDDGLIPPNVANALNFYQAEGVLHGRAEIVASDPLRTEIIGNFRMMYKDYPINCDAFPWFARTFMKSHIEIENDSRIWRQAALLIDSELSQPVSTDQTQPSSASPLAPIASH